MQNTTIEENRFRKGSKWNYIRKMDRPYYGVFLIAAFVKH